MPVIKWLFFFALLSPLNSKAELRIDDSIEIFFPPGLQYLQFSQTEFSFFWWNFVVVEPQNGQPDFEKAKTLCEKLSQSHAGTLRRLICNDDLTSIEEALGRFARDIVLREPFRAVRVLPALETALGDLAMIGSANPTMLNLKRKDPLDQWQIYLEHSQKISSQSLNRIRGFLVDPVSHRIVIPVQFSKPPKLKNTEAVMGILEDEKAQLLGAHAGAYTNEKQVSEDLAIVSLVGGIVLFLFIGFLVLRGRWGALFLLPPLAASMFVAGLITHWIFGSIHGLTLAFGTGIVGLGLDYGLHGAFNSESKQIWKSNLTGLLTTIAGLATLLRSSIPLLQQMMTFAVLGISICFVTYYFCCRTWPRVFTFRPLKFRIPKFRYGLLIVAVLIAIGVWGSRTLKFDFDLNRFNYQTAEQIETNKWFFTLGPTRENILLIQPQEEMEEALQAGDWADTNRISYLGIGSYLPPSKVQNKNSETWQRMGCLVLNSKLDPSTQKAFEPFVTSICTTPLKALNFSDLQEREYLSDMVGNRHLVTVFMAKDDSEESLIRQKFPESRALVESLNDFSKSMRADLEWMLPVALGLAMVILLLYYRRILYVIAALIPFLTGLGLFFAAQLFFRQDIDLISVLGLLMVFGFSLDYGVFASDISAFPQGKNNEVDVHSALCLAAMSNIVGFFPMLFAKHAMLHQLGTALFFGTIGTYVGTIWGVGAFIKMFEGKKHAKA